MSKNHDDNGPSWIAIIIMLCCFPPVGFIMLLLKFKNSAKSIERRRLRRQEKLAGRYLAVIGGSVTMSIKSIASAMGVDYDTACRDMRNFMLDGFFPKNSYLDLGKGLFVLDKRYAPDDADAEFRRAFASDQSGKAQVKAEKPSAQPQPQKAPVKPANAAPSKPAISKEEAEYVEKLRQIRALNDAIQNDKVSAQIDHIERITANIFELVVTDAGKKESTHTFMNYYLPTTLKLLTAYSRLEKQNVSGENIDASKKKIEQMLDQLVWAFERQNDQMFASDALDISSDVKVMETMMARDGLSKSKADDDPFKVARQGG